MTVFARTPEPVALSEENPPSASYHAPIGVSAGQPGRPLHRMGPEELSAWLVAQPLSLDEALGEHHQIWLRAGSRLKADAWMERQSLVFTTYGELPIGNPVDWTLGADGRANLSWQLHSFFFVRDFVASHKLTRDERYLEALDGILQSWMRHAEVPAPDSRFAWNDHSTAYRLHALSQYFVYLSGLGAPAAGRLAEVYRLVVRHQAVLLSKHLYSRGTNHGLDQAFYLYVSAAIVPLHSGSQDVRQTALERLRHELLRSFAEDGVHIENSPEYHDLVLSSVGYMGTIVAALEQDADLIHGLNGRLFEAVRFLAYILRPDGLLPTVGDSTLIRPRSAHARLAGAPAYPSFLHARSQGAEGADELPDCAVFNASGYAVLRGAKSASTPLRAHAVFKCGFLSTYHRHDDDNSLVLYARGEDWLIDAGLYQHEEKDPVRIYMRSAQAHNLLVPVGAGASRKVAEVVSGLTASDLTSQRATVVGETTMFAGFHYRRSLAFDPSADSLEIFDSCARVAGRAGATQSYELLFHIPSDKTIQTSGNEVTIASTKSRTVLTIQLDPKGLGAVEVTMPDTGATHGWYSPAYGQLQPAQTVRAVYTGYPNLALRTGLTFD